MLENVDFSESILNINYHDTALNDGIFERGLNKDNLFALGRTRTSNRFFRKEVLYPLSYKCLNNGL